MDVVGAFPVGATVADGPHTCPAMDLARLETLIGARTAIAGLPGLALDQRHPVTPSGPVFRKPRTLHARWLP